MLISQNSPFTKEFGGYLLKNSHAKVVRPLSYKKPISVVMKSHRRQSLLNSKIKILRIIKSQARHFKIRIQQVQINANNLILVVRTTDRDSYCGFSRACSGLIARLVTGSQKGSPKKIRFWQQRPFSAFLNINYVRAGTLITYLQNFGLATFKYGHQNTS